MNVDDILQQLEELFDRARAALEQQVSTAHKAVASLNQEKAAATKAVTELKDQHSKAKADLDAAMNNLDRVSSLGSIQAEIKKARRSWNGSRARQQKSQKLWRSWPRNERRRKLALPRSMPTLDRLQQSAAGRRKRLSSLKSSLEFNHDYRER